MQRLSFIAPTLVSLACRTTPRGIYERFARRGSTMSASASPSPRKRRVPLAVAPVPSEADALRMHVKAERIVAALTTVYPVAPAGFLDHRNDFTLLVAVVLSAQTTDVKVNQVTPALFDAADNPRDMAALGVDRVLDFIRTVGLAPGKSRNVVGLSERILEEHGGKVPKTFEELENLPGVGHKTASVLMMQAHGMPAFPVDTHIHRLACRWGCGVAKSVEKTEANLKLWFPDDTTWGELHTRIILFGREHCHARKHDMNSCSICSFAATDEARTLNLSNPLKFIAAATHKDPYAIRSIVDSAVKSDPRNLNAELAEELISDIKPSVEKAAKRARRSYTKKDVVVGDQAPCAGSQKAERKQKETNVTKKVERNITTAKRVTRSSRKNL